MRPGSRADDRSAVRPSTLRLLARALRSGGGGGVFFLVGLVFTRFGQRFAQCLQLVLRLVRLVGDLGRRRAETVQQRMDAIGVRLVLFELLAERAQVAQDALGARDVQIPNPRPYRRPCWAWSRRARD
jgi:hypothetical protein